MFSDKHAWVVFFSFSPLLQGNSNNKPAVMVPYFVLFYYKTTYDSTHMLLTQFLYATSYIKFKQPKVLPHNTMQAAKHCGIW